MALLHAAMRCNVRSGDHEGSEHKARRGRGLQNVYPAIGGILVVLVHEGTDTVTPAIAERSEGFPHRATPAAEEDEVSSLAVHFFSFFHFSKLFPFFHFLFRFCSFSIFLRFFVHVFFFHYLIFP